MSGAHLTSQAYAEASISSYADPAASARVLSLASWAKTTDRTARTANGRKANRERFLDLVDPGHVLEPEERQRRADKARREWYAEMGRKSAASRRAKRLAA